MSFPVFTSRPNSGAQRGRSRPGCAPRTRACPLAQNQHSVVTPVVRAAVLGAVVGLPGLAQAAVREDMMQAPAVGIGKGTGTCGEYLQVIEAEIKARPPRDIGPDAGMTD